MTRAEVRVLVVDDDGASRQALKALLVSKNYDVDLAADGVAALERVAEFAPDLVVTDLDMPRMNGLELLTQLRQRDRDLPVIVVTAATELTSGVAAMRLGAADYIAKPICFDDLALAIERAIEHRNTRLEVKRLRELTEGAERSMRALLAHLPDALITTSATGEITFLNGEAERVLMTQTAAVKGRQLGEVFPGLAKIHESRLKGENFEALPELKVANSLYAPAVGRMVLDGVLTIAVTLRDVTEKHRLENRRLDFYSMVAHDLRTPLAAMTLRVGMMKREQHGPLPVGYRKDLELVDSRIGELVNLINDFLDIARSEGVGLSLAPQLIDLGALVSENLADFNEIAHLSEVKIHFAEPKTPVDTFADPARIKQVITNLISNAVKFSPKGGQVLIEVAKRELDVEFTVSDAGRGIAEDKISELFQRYSRPATDAALPGTGLGLMIVREIVAAHAGTCGVKSSLGKGSRFWFRLPQAAAQPGIARTG